MDVDALSEANQLEDPNMLQVGQELLIPGPNFKLPAKVTATPLPTPTGRVTLTVKIATATPTVLPSPQSEQNETPSGVRYVCPSNVTVHALELPGDPIQLALVDDMLYFVANGDLYRLPAPGAKDREQAKAENLVPADRKVGDYEIRELVYVAAEPASGDLLLLDKSDDVYRYSPDGTWRMAHPATAIPGQFPDPQFLAVQPGTAVEPNSAFVLDADLSHVWQLLPDSGMPQAKWSSGRLLNALDMHVSSSPDGDPQFTFLMRDGTVMRLVNGSAATLYRPERPEDGVQPWLAQLLAIDDLLAIVDAEGRTIVALDPNNGSVRWEIAFRLPDMQRLRSAALAGDTLYAVAGRNLYVADLPAGASCPPAAFDNAYYFQGHDLQQKLPAVQAPFAGMILPDRPRSYPGARRLYRNGIHEGVDLYSTEAPGVGFGAYVHSIADGTITRARCRFQRNDAQRI